MPSALPRASCLDAFFNSSALGGPTVPVGPSLLRLGYGGTPRRASSSWPWVVRVVRRSPPCHFSSCLAWYGGPRRASSVPSCLRLGYHGTPCRASSGPSGAEGCSQGPRAVAMRWSERVFERAQPVESLTPTPLIPPRSGLPCCRQAGARYERIFFPIRDSRLTIRALLPAAQRPSLLPQAGARNERILLPIRHSRFAIRDSRSSAAQRHALLPAGWSEERANPPPDSPLAIRDSRSSSLMPDA
jgi:hypothetical protein